MGLFGNKIKNEEEERIKNEEYLKRVEKEKAEKEERQRKELERAEYIQKMCVASKDIPGYTIKENKGMVCGVVTYQSPFKGMFFARPAGSEEYSELVDEAIKEARIIAYKKAEELGANAIVNVDLDFNEFEFHTKLIMEFVYLYVTVHFNGDAVVVEKE